MKLTAQNIDGRLNEMLSLVQDLRDKLEKESDELEKEKQDRERDVKSLSTQLDKERADRKEDVEALRRVSPHVHVRLFIKLTVNTTGHAAHYTSSSPCSIGPCTREGSRPLQLRFLGRPRKQKRIRISRQHIQCTFERS
jgi:hypothetical protein